MSWRGPIHSPKSRHNPKESKETANKNQTKHKTQPKHQQTTKQQKQERESDRLASSAMSTKRWGVITLYHPYIGYGGKTNKADQKNNITNIAIPGLWVKQHSTMRKPGLPLPGAPRSHRASRTGMKTHRFAIQLPATPMPCGNWKGETTQGETESEPDLEWEVSMGIYCGTHSSLRILSVDLFQASSSV